MNNRRKLLIMLGAGALVAPFGSFAQPPGKVWRVGFLSPRHVDFLDSDSYYGPFRQGMRDLGYFDGKNLVIEWRSAEGKYERLPGLATELVNLKMDVIVTAGTPATSAAQKATTTIAIVMGSVGDPVGSGFIKSLARPAGNITGLSNMSGDVSPKQLEMLLDMVPKLSRLAVLVNPDNSSQTTVQKNLQAAARGTAVTILFLEARAPQEIENAFSIMAQKKAGAVIVMRDPSFNQHVRQIVERAAKQRLPLIGGIREYVEAGGLMSYGAAPADSYRRAATYVDKILKGAKPGDLPIEQPTKFEMVINGKTAKALGLKIPNSILVRADEVIE
jgi:putative ABC transport system substrate-binding protein